MSTFLMIIGFVMIAVFIIKGLVSLIRKKNFKKDFMIAGIGFVLFIAGMIMMDTPKPSDVSSEKVETKKEVAKEEVPKSEPVQEVEEPVAPVEPVEETNDPGISKAEFDKIQNGMSYEEVVAIIGGEGNLQSESGSKGDQFYTVMYGFDGESGLGSNAILMFQGNKLETKSQFGLE